MKKSFLILSLFSIFTLLLPVHASMNYSDSELESIERWKDKFIDLKLSSSQDGNKAVSESDLKDIASCSMKSTRFSDLLAKTQELVATLQDQCKEKDDQGRIKDIAGLIEKMQKELQEKGIVDANKPDIIPTEIDGIKVNLLFQNINNLVKKGQCRRDEMRVLDVTADVIQDITALGILSPTPQGLLISGGGAVLATALRLIDTLLKDQFDFEKTKDRASFIKLNCSFYELRKQLYVSGFYEMDKNSIKRDAETLKALETKVNNHLQALKAQVENLKKEDGLSVELKAELKKLSTSKETLSKVQAFLQSKTEDTNLPKETVRLKWIGAISSNAVPLEAAINHYISLENRPLPFMDDHFLLLALSFSPANIASLQKYFNMNYEDFSNGPRAQLLYHTERVVNELVLRESEVKKKASLGNIPQKIAELQKEITLTEKQAQDLKIIVERMKTFENQKMFDRFDDGSENSVAIIDNMNAINKQVFGQYGFKFIDYSMKKSSQELEDWQKGKQRLEKRHVNIIREIEAESFDDDITNLERTYFCQDLQALRQGWAYVTSVADLGYDFLAINRDLFNTYTHNFYGMRNDEETTLIITQIEKIQRHYLSAVYAKRVIGGLEVEADKKDKYLSNAYFGKVMMDVVHESRAVSRYDRMFEKAKCSKLFQMNL